MDKYVTIMALFSRNTFDSGWIVFLSEFFQAIVTTDCDLWEVNTQPYTYTTAICNGAVIKKLQWMMDSITPSTFGPLRHIQSETEVQQSNNFSVFQMAIQNKEIKAQQHLPSHGNSRCGECH